MFIFNQLSGCRPNRVVLKHSDSVVLRTRQVRWLRKRSPGLPHHEWRGQNRQLIQSLQFWPRLVESPNNNNNSSLSSCATEDQEPVCYNSGSRSYSPHVSKTGSVSQRGVPNTAQCWHNIQQKYSVVGVEFALHKSEHCIAFCPRQQPPLLYYMANPKK